MNRCIRDPYVQWCESLSLLVSSRAGYSIIGSAALPTKHNCLKFPRTLSEAIYIHGFKGKSLHECLNCRVRWLASSFYFFCAVGLCVAKNKMCLQMRWLYLHFCFCLFRISVLINVFCKTGRQIKFVISSTMKMSCGLDNKSC